MFEKVQYLKTKVALGASGAFVALTPFVSADAATDAMNTSMAQLSALILGVTTVFPSLIQLIVAVIPLIIITAVVGAIVVFIKNVLERVHLG